MASNNEFQLIGKQGFLQGFPNLFGKEIRHWWGTKYWLVQLAIWLVIINGFIALIYALPAEELYGNNPDPAEQAILQQMQQQPELLGLIAFLRLSGFATAIGVVIIAQDAMIAEKQSGTAAWIFSKPVTRSAFVLSKLAGNGLGILGIMDVLVGGIFYIQIWLITGIAVPIQNFAGMLGLTFVYQLFYLALALMLGTLFRSRGPVISIPFVLIFIPVILGIPSILAEIMPWNLMMDLEKPALAFAASQGEPLPTLMPLIASCGWCLVFNMVALWKFKRDEF